MVIPPSFSATFSKGDTFHCFLFAYLEDEVFLKWGLLFKERICCDGRKKNPHEMISVKLTVASPESVPIHLG